MNGVESSRRRVAELDEVDKLRWREAWRAGHSHALAVGPNSPVYTEGKAQLSPRLARLFVVFFVDLVRNVRDGKRSTLPTPNPTTLCIQRTSRS